MKKKFNEVFERGINLLRLNESDEKIRKEFNKALRYKLDNSSISCICGYLLKYNKPNLVGHYLTILVKSYPTDVDVYLTLGYYYFLLDRFNKSLEYLEKIVSFNSKNASLKHKQNPLFCIILLFNFIFLERYKSALDSINEYLSKENSEKYLVFKCLILYILGKPNEAKPIINEFLDEEGNVLSSHEENKCHEDFTELKQIVDNNIEVEAVKYYCKGMIYQFIYELINLKTKEAIEHYKKAMDIDPKFKFIEPKKKELEILLDPNL